MFWEGWGPHEGAPSVVGQGWGKPPKGIFPIFGGLLVDLPPPHAHTIKQGGDELSNSLNSLKFLNIKACNDLPFFLSLHEIVLYRRLSSLRWELVMDGKALPDR